MADQIYFEEDQYFLQYVVSDTRSNYIANIIKQRFDSIIAYKAIDFKSNVVKKINECLQKHGIPMFRTRYANQPFPGNSALMVCYASHDGRMKGVWFKDIPEEDLKVLAAKEDGYTYILRKYSIGEKIMQKNYSYGQQTPTKARVGYKPTTPQETALQQLKAETEKAIPDEQDAQKMYDKMATLAHNAGMNDIAMEIQLIRAQEYQHERYFRGLLSEIGNKHIADNKNYI
jgi:hypothetical protein